MKPFFPRSARFILCFCPIIERMPKKLLITDLDNTLYDWVTFFTLAFRGMVEELTKLLDVSEQELLDEFRVVHQKYGNSEQPFAVLELPSVLRRYPGLTRAEVTQKLDPALHRFNSIRKRTLSLYPGSAETFQHLTERGVTIVGHTEAILANAYWRIKTLGYIVILAACIRCKGRMRYISAINRVGLTLR